MFQTDQYNGRNVLIIGGLGFIGANLAARLVNLDARVMIIDSLIPEYGGNLFNIEPFKDKVTVYPFVKIVFAFGKMSLRLISAYGTGSVSPVGRMRCHCRG